jgi:multiple sugar transport system permease protein
MTADSQTHPGRRAARARALTGKVAVTLVLAVVAVFMIFPVYWMVLSSFKGSGELFRAVPTFWPETFEWSNYTSIPELLDFGTYFSNSVIVAVSTTILSVGIGCISGYSFARFRYRGRSAAVFVLLVTQMFPAALLVIPMFTLLNAIGLTNTQLGLILAYTAFILPFAVWMMKGFFETIPVELEEAAMIDGCTRLGALVRVVLPVAAPGAAAAAAFAFVSSWNEFLFALSLTTGVESRTLPVGLSLLLSPYFNNWGVLMAAGVITSIPTILMFVFLQKYLVRGLTAGAVK